MSLIEDTVVQCTTVHVKFIYNTVIIVEIFRAKTFPCVGRPDVQSLELFFLQIYRCKGEIYININIKKKLICHGLYTIQGDVQCIYAVRKQKLF